MDVIDPTGTREEFVDLIGLARIGQALALETRAISFQASCVVIVYILTVTA